MRVSRSKDARGIDLAERHAGWGGPVAEAMAGADARFGVSPLVKCECLVGPL
jgi:hypothetical protein